MLTLTELERNLLLPTVEFEKRGFGFTSGYWGDASTCPPALAKRYIIPRRENEILRSKSNQPLADEIRLAKAARIGREITATAAPHEVSDQDRQERARRIGDQIHAEQVEQWRTHYGC